METCGRPGVPVRRPGHNVFAQRVVQNKDGDALDVLLGRSIDAEAIKITAIAKRWQHLAVGVSLVRLLCRRLRNDAQQQFLVVRATACSHASLTIN